MNLTRPIRVKNKNPAPIQITAEQILREARERQDAGTRPVNQKITDAAELADYRLRKRKEFEDSIRRARSNKSVWVNYANWEESQNDFTRARSVWERAIEVDYRDHTLWLKYAEFEMKNKFVNQARNVCDRAVELLPRVDQLWYKYILMEEILGDVDCARRVFDRWMKWMPDEHGWMKYIKFELSYKEIERARSIFERFVDCCPRIGAWIQFVEFEMKNGDVARARSCYQRALDKYGDDDEELLKRFPEFGGNQHGGDRDDIVGKKRFEYENEVRKNPHNYDAWFDYLRLEESNGGIKERIEELYERAIANVPLANEKRYWQRYIYLWINYVLYEEFEVKDVDRTRNVYALCLKTIPHRKFSFAKIWWMAAQFEIRQLNIDRARRILGQAIGMAPRGKIFKKYIEIEMQLGNIERVRKVYEKYLEWSPEKCSTWMKFAELERSLGETERARGVYELGINQPVLDTPELLWKAYIEFENSECEYERSRALYERLLNRTKHMKRRLVEETEDDEEYIETRPTTLKILEAAYKWKKQKKEESF